MKANPHPFARGAAVAALFLFAACSGASVARREDPALAGLRSAGYRVAVLPFTVSAPEEGFLTGSLAPVGQLFALEVGTQTLPPHDMIGGVLRAGVLSWLQQSSFEVVEQWVSDTQLAHTGFDREAAADPANARRIAQQLQVDGLVFGDVTRWNRSYYVVQTTAEVGLRLELIDGGSGKTLYWTERTETLGSGLSGGPTGVISVATGPIAGLKASSLRELTRSVARSSVADLNGGSLDNEAGPLAPRLSLVALAQAHPGPFRVGERVDVLAVGTPGCEVRFDLGRLRTGVPMVQTQEFKDPRGDRASYAGHYVVQPGDVAAGLPLQCTIRRTGAQRTQTSRYRWQGTLELAGG